MCVGVKKYTEHELQKIFLANIMQKKKGRNNGPLPSLQNSLRARKVPMAAGERNTAAAADALY